MGVGVLAVVLALLVLAAVGVLTVVLGNQNPEQSAPTSAIGGIVVLFLVLVCGMVAWGFLVG